MTQLYGGRQPADVDDSEVNPAAATDSDSDRSDSDGDDQSVPQDKQQQQQPLPAGCRRVQLRSRLLNHSFKPAAGSEDARKFEVILRAPPIGDRSADAIGSTAAAGDAENQQHFLRVHANRLSYVLDAMQPRCIILYEPRVAWVREIEVHMARRHGKAADRSPDKSDLPVDGDVQPLNVFFMVYENSVEEQRYLTNLRRVSL